MAGLVQSPCDDAVIRSGTATAPCAKKAAAWILSATILGSSMAFIDGTVVNVALAALQRDFNATVPDVQWVIEAYSLFLSALLLLGGSLGDHYGRRRIFVLGVTFFALASAWCGLAPNIRQLIYARAVQGAAAALLIPGSLAIISATFPKDGRARAIGTWSGFTAITAAIGPVLGGWLIEHISWRAVFFLNLPLAAAVVIISFFHLPESRDDMEKARLDWTGALLATIGLGALVYGLIESSRLGFGNPIVLIGLMTGFLVLGAFAIFEDRAKNPMLPLILFRSRNFTGANLLTLFLYSALGGTLFFVPLNLIQVQDYNATAAGAALLPFILIMFLFSRWSGGLVERYGARLPLVVGPIVAAMGFALFALPGIGVSYWTYFFPAMVVLGFGMAISVAPLTTTVMNSVPENRVGVASGINNAVARTAGLLAVAVFGILMLQEFNRALDAHLSKIELSPNVRHALDSQRIKLAAIMIPGNVDPPARQAIARAIDESFLNGFRMVMIAGAGLAFAGGIVGLGFIEGASSHKRASG